jgi:hypothetical protein
VQDHPIQRLDRLEELAERLLQELECLLDAIYPPRPERPLLRVIVGEVKDRMRHHVWRLRVRYYVGCVAVVALVLQFGAR